MDSFILKLKKCCEIIFSTLQLDVYLFDDDNTQILFLYKEPYPTSLLTYWSNYINYIHSMTSNLSSEEPVYCIWHELSDCSVILLDVRITTPTGKNLYITIGPALTKMYSIEFCPSLPHWEKLSPREKTSTVKLFKSLPFFTTQVKNAFWLSWQMLQNVYNINSFSIKNPFLKHEIMSSDSPISLSYEQPISPDQIKLNYEIERKWRAFVSAGDFLNAKKIIEQAASTDFSSRTSSNSIQGLINHCLSMNILCRVAASDGGAFATDIHNIYEYFTVQIENVKTVLDIERISEEMLRSYCNIVISAQVNSFSPPVRKAIAYIYEHYDQPITLQLLAKEIHYSEGHLSRIFQKETGKTLNQYLHQLRIDNACRLLDTRIYSITDISVQVGFSSYSKFSVEFKKQTGITATEYLKKTSNQEYSSKNTIDNKLNSDYYALITNSDL